MNAFFDSLYGVSPALALSIKFLLVVCVLILIWIIASIPAAVLYAALGRGIFRAADFFGAVAINFLQSAKALWATVSKLRDEAIESLSLRYVYDHSESRLLKSLTQIKRSTDFVGKQVHTAATSLETKITPLATEITIITDAQHLSIETLQIPDLKVLQDSSRVRRTAFIMLVICIPIVVALVVVNTALLTKFFESFFEEYINYKLGIKWATMIGLLFSIIELALGVFFYHYSKEENPDPLLGPAKKLLFIFLILALACIEGYLYMLLSADIAKQIKDSNLSLPAGLEGMHSWWLAPFGFVVVITLALVGHAVMDSVNKFAEAGHLKELRAILEAVKRSIVRMGSNWDGLKTKSDTARKGLLQFNNELRGDNQGVAGVLLAIAEAIEKMTQTVSALALLRREPISTITKAESGGIYRTHVFLVSVFILVSAAFCWLQIHFMTMIPAFGGVDWAIFLLLAIVEATAIIFGSYRAYPSVTSLVEGIGTETLRSTEEKAISAVCVIVIVAAAVLNLFLTSQESHFAWAIMYSLAIISIGVLVLVGRTLPIAMLVAGVMIRQTLAALAAFGAALASALSWIAHALLIVLSYFSYFLAYPFLALFWKSHLQDQVTALEAK